MIKKFEEFVNEGMWKSGIDRAKENSMRVEDGIRVKLPNGDTVEIDDRYDGVPYKLDGDNYYKLIDDIEGVEIYIFGLQLDGEYVYYLYDGDEELSKLITSDYDMVKDDFTILKSVISSDNMYKDPDDGVQIEKLDDLSFMCADSYGDKFAIIYGGDGDDKALEFFTNELMKRLDKQFDPTENDRTLEDMFNVIIGRYGCGFFDFETITNELEEVDIDVPEDEEEIIDAYIEEMGFEKLIQCLNFEECAKTIMRENDYNFREVDECGTLIKEEEEFDINNKTIFVFTLGY